MKYKKALQVKELVRPFHIQVDSSTQWNSDSLRETSLILFTRKHITPRFSRFKNTLVEKLGMREDLHVYQVVDTDLDCKPDDSAFISCIALDSFLASKLIKESLSIPDTFGTNPAVIIDSLGRIRQYYSLNDTNAYVRILEHLAFLLPPVKKKKLLLKQH